MTKKTKVAVPKRDAIVAEIHGQLLVEKKSAVQIGRLLCQLRGEVDHGQWLPILEREFSMSDHTARNYMGAHLFLIKIVAPLLKSEKFSDLKLRSTALYALAKCYEGVGDGAEFEFDQSAYYVLDDDNRAVELEADDLLAILTEAQQRWVGLKRINEIMAERHPATADDIPPQYDPRTDPDKLPLDESANDNDDSGDGDDDDRPPNPNPGRATGRREKSKLEAFTGAIESLNNVFTGSAQEFVDADVDDNAIQKLIDALGHLLKCRKADPKRSPGSAATEIPLEERRIQNEALAEQAEAA